MISARTYSRIDSCLLHVDQMLRAFTANQTARRPHPAAQVQNGELSAEQQQLSARLMRVNHAGEVAAQGLYHGQAFGAKTATLATHLQQAALDEGEHLVWCAQRVAQLGSHVSYFTPVWYAGAWMIGCGAGYLGDAWSLGFVVETEVQVEQHLRGHLQRLPVADRQSHAILEQMQRDEIAHGAAAMHAGARVLPGVIKIVMRACAKVMTGVAFWW